jgi:hypothetical protein
MFLLDQIIEIKLFEMMKSFFAPLNYIENAMTNTDFGTFKKWLANYYFDWAMQHSLCCLGSVSTIHLDL